jgi:uncharacterized protein (DUF362 family)
MDMPQSKPLDESMLASATWETVHRVGVVTSSFRGGKEHDGTEIAGLTDPQPNDATLTQTQTAALLQKATELSARSGGRRSSLRAGSGSDDWVVFLITLTPEISTDTQLMTALLDEYAKQRRGKRFTIAASAPATPEYVALVQNLAARHTQIRFEFIDLSRDAFLQVPATRRTFAERNPDGVYAIAKTIRECDRLISVAPLQTSGLTGVALTTANYWDIAPTSVYGPRREKLRALGTPVDLLTDLYLHHPADFAILGGHVHRDVGGPVHHNIVIAGSNAIAVDAIGAAVMGFDPLRLPLLDRLEARGFGVAVPDSIWTRGNEIEEARRPFQKPPEFS